MITFRKKYFALAILFLLIEVIIAAFINDRFIRPYFGDFLVVIMLYCFVRAFLTMPVKAAVIGVLLFAYAVELTQYFHLIDHLGLRHSALVRTIIGGSFDWSDMLAYTLGCLAVWLIEVRR